MVPSGPSRRRVGNTVEEGGGHTNEPGVDFYIGVRRRVPFMTVLCPPGVQSPSKICPHTVRVQSQKLNDETDVDTPPTSPM